MVSSWNYSTQNWIYAVLSRVKTLDGLFTCKEFNDAKEFVVDPSLKHKTMRVLEQKKIVD